MDTLSDPIASSAAASSSSSSHSSVLSSAVSAAASSSGLSPPPAHRATDAMSAAQPQQPHQPVVAELLAWMRAHGADVGRLEIRYLGKDEGHGVFAAQALRSGDVTIRVPFRLTMSVESAAASDLAPVLGAYRELPPDEVLALHLMHERGKGAGSFFAPFLRSLPRAFDLPVYWSDEQLQELAGTNVLLLTQMMKRQLAQDFAGIHSTLMDEFPDVFAPRASGPNGGEYVRPTLADYEWAMGVIWSRAFGVTRGQTYMHVLCPAMDMFNHDVRLRNPLDDFVRFDADAQTLEHRVCSDSGAVSTGTPLLISYGQYSNAKLLYSYGFAVPTNARQSLDLWMKVPPSDPYSKLKQTLLDSSELTREQTYDFRGTLFPDDIDERLLATLRVILLDEQDIRHYKNAFEESIVSVRNELAVYENLQLTCHRKLSNYPTTIEDDRVILKSAQLQRDSRLAFAVQVRLEDKLVLAGVIATLDAWKLSLATDPAAYPPHSTRRAKCELKPAAPAV